MLLDEICNTYGTEPTISKAETFRTGGVLGFFQREHYRLVVDAPAGPLNPAGGLNAAGGVDDAGAANPAETKKATLPMFSRKGSQASRKAAAVGPRQRTGTPKPAHTAALAALASSPPPLVLPEPAPPPSVQAVQASPSVQAVAVRTYSDAAAAAYSAAASAAGSPSASASADEMTASEFLESLDGGCWATGHAADPFESVAASTADDDVVLTSVRPIVEEPAQHDWASSGTGEFPSFEEVLRKV
ncbi:MAG TPA: hypothetical protein VFH70_00175, partial [Acidimicrobiales bacterium]|nr:hypothetical protein [Acidimicrobiales bacterium]